MPKRPFVASLDQVKITRTEEVASIEYADPDVGGVSLTLGPKISSMSDLDILDTHNEIIRATEEMRATAEHVAHEIPVGKPQVEYNERCEQWCPRGDVVRAVVTCDEQGQALLDIDGREFTMEEVGTLLLSLEGFGLRLTFVDEDHVDEQPAIEIYDPDNDEPIPPSDETG